jgi:hypothetical protein
MSPETLSKLDEILKDYKLPVLKTPRQSREALRALVEASLQGHSWVHSGGYYEVSAVTLQSRDSWELMVHLTGRVDEAIMPLTQFMEEAVIDE